ncbi:MAG: oligosaccharide flippase family protein [Rhodococcus sp. (in: high G+C Gram-positive bacteria)]|uniref:lipopolysaccharide biosynthesis protein n=1 Tax=Rhodococcus sp. TaxID=1831 RepID=UPI003BB062E6
MAEKSTAKSGPFRSAMQSRLANSPSMIAIGRFITMFFSLATVPIVARALGPDGRGIAATMLAVLAITQVLLGLGIPLAVRRRVIVGDDRSDVMMTARLYAALTTIPALAVAFSIDVILFTEQTTTTRIAFYISMALIPLTVSWATDVSVLVATEEYLRMALLGIVQAGSSFLVVLAIWMIGKLDISSVIYATLAGNVVTFFVGLCWVGARGGRVRHFWSLAREGCSLVGGQMAGIATGRVDQIIVLPILGAGGAGIYSIALTLGSLPTPVAQAVGAGSFANFSRGERQLVLKSIRHSAALCIVTAAILGVASYFLIPVVFGTAFADAIPAALIMVGGSIFTGVAFVASMALAAQRKGARMTTIQVGGVLVGLALLAPLAVTWGAVGAASAMTGGSAVTLILALHQLRISPLEALPRSSDWLNSFRDLIRI